MGFLVYGQYALPINTAEVFVRCKCCQRFELADLLLESNYYHLYWIPMFPFDKTAHLICKACGCKTYGVGFNKRVVPEYNELKSRFRHPLRLWTGTLVLAFPVLVAVLAALGLFR